MWRFGVRFFSMGPPTTTLAEKHIVSKLKEAFKKAKIVEAEDISGGCGSMYKVRVEAPEFSGKLKVQQHKMVTDCLKEDIKNWHGIVIETKAV